MQVSRSALSPHLSSVFFSCIAQCTIAVCWCVLLVKTFHCPPHTTRLVALAFHWFVVVQPSANSLVKVCAQWLGHCACQAVFDSTWQNLMILAAIASCTQWQSCVTCFFFGMLKGAAVLRMTLSPSPRRSIGPSACTPGMCRLCWHSRIKSAAIPQMLPTQIHRQRFQLPSVALRSISLVCHSQTG